MQIKVQENSKQRLKIKLTPTRQWLGLLFGAIFVGLSYVVLLAMGTSTDLKLGPKTLDITTRSALRGNEQESVSRDQIQSVSVELFQYGIGQSYEVVIKTTDKDYPLSFPTLDGDAKRAMADELTQLIAKPDGRFENSSGSLAFAIGLAAMVLLAGLSSLVLVQSSTITADRESDKLCISRNFCFIPLPTKCLSARSYERVNLRSFRVSGVESYYATAIGDKQASLAVGPMFTDTSIKEISNTLSDWVNRKR